MKKSTILIAVAVINLSACHPTGSGSGTGSTSVTPTSTFSITFNGKTVNLTSSTTVPYTTISALTTSQQTYIYGDPVGNVYAAWTTSTMVSSSKLSCEFIGEKLDPSSPTGLYRSGSFTSPSSASNNRVYGPVVLTDYDDGGKVYKTDYSGHDTTGTITVTTSSSTECKGTFNIVLTYNGNYYPATGSFDYKH